MVTLDGQTLIARLSAPASPRARPVPLPALDGWRIVARTEGSASMVTLPLHVPVSYPPVTGLADARAFAVRETTPPGPPKPRLLDRVRHARQARHGSRRTEKAHVAWIRRSILFHGQRHLADMGAAEITQFLSSLAVEGHVAASTQNQALSAVLFLYRPVLEQDLPGLDGVVRAKRAERLPVVLTREEVRAILRELQSPPRSMAILIYTHVLNRGPAGVRSPVDRMLAP